MPGHPSPTTPAGAFAAAQGAVLPVDHAAGADARHLSDRLTKPRGALGRLEALGAQLAAIAGVCPPPVPEPAAVAVFAADHGVVAEGVTPWPSEVTAQMVANLVSGGAAINVLARQIGAPVLVVDVGVATALPEGLASRGLIEARVRNGTGNIAVEQAMTAGQVVQALDLGAAIAAQLIAAGSGQASPTGDWLAVAAVALGALGVALTAFWLTARSRA